MKILEKLILIIFSIVVLFIAVLMIVYKVGIIGNVEIKSIYEFLTSGNIGTAILVVNILLIMLAIKNIFFSTKIDQERTDGILMENESGKLLITKNTLENLVNSVTRSVAGTESTSSKIILDKENNIIVLVTMVMSQETNLKYLINKLQSEIKDTIKQSIDIDVKEVNIKIKNIAIKSNEQKALPSKNDINTNSFTIQPPKEKYNIEQIAKEEKSLNTENNLNNNIEENVSIKIEENENLDGGKNE